MDKSPKIDRKLTDAEIDELADAQLFAYLESEGAIRPDGTIDESKLEFYDAQTFEELEALLCQMKDAKSPNSPPTDG